MGGFLGFGAKSSTVRAQRIGEFTITEAAYSKPVPIVFGTARLSGNMIDFVDFQAHEHQHHTGGKGGGGGVTQITYTYTVAATLALCEGPITGLNKVFKDKEIVDPARMTEQNYMVLRKGTYGQAPWEYMEGKHPERALTYSGLACLHGIWDLGDTGQFPALSFEVSGLLAGRNGDAAPFDVIRTILTDGNWGCGWTEDMIGDSRAYVDYCEAYGLGVSVCLTDQTAVDKVLDGIMKATNSTMRWSKGKLYFVPLEHRAKGKYRPDLRAQYHIDESDVVEGSAIIVMRKPLERKYNQRVVEFSNRDNFYEKEAVYAEDLTDIHVNGLKPANVLSLPYITGKEQAQYIAQQTLLRDQYIRNQYKFKLGVKHSLLEPGDIVYISSKELMIDRVPVMILSKVEDNNAEYDIVAEDVMFKVEGGEVNKTDNASPYIVDRATVPTGTRAFAFEPSLEMADASGKLEVWVAACGRNDWGGASVWTSFDNAHYERAGFLEKPSTMGTVLSDDGAGNIMVQLDHGEIMEKDGLIGYFGGTFLTIERAALSAPGRYALRVPREHQRVERGSDFAIVEDLFEIPYDIERIGSYMYVKVVAYNEYGTAEEDISTVKPITVYLEGSTPPDVDGVLVEQMENVKRIVWDYALAGKPYIAGYRIKCNAGRNTSWGDAYDLADGLVTSSPFDTSQLDNSGIYTILVKAVTKAGVESRDPACALINLGDTIVDNVIWEQDMMTSALVLHNAAWKDGVVKANDNGQDFYPADAAAFYPTSPATLFYRSAWHAMEALGRYQPEQAGTMSFDVDIEGNYRIWYREVWPYHFYPEDYQLMFPDDGARIYVEGPWLPYAGKALTAKASPHEMRLEIKGGEYQGIVRRWRVLVDVPDISEALEDVPIKEGGTRLPITKDYRRITALNCAIQSSKGITVQIVDKDIRGPLVKIVDAAGKAVPGLLDVRVQGF